MGLQEGLELAMDLIFDGHIGFYFIVMHPTDRSYFVNTLYESECEH